MHSHHRNLHRPRTIEKESNEIKEERFDKAFFISLGIFALFFLLVFIPVLGLILTLTIVPYFAGYQGGKFVNRRDAVLVAFLSGFIWTILEIYIFITILSNLNLAVITPGIYTGTDWLLIILLFLSNILFCIIGALFSPRSFGFGTGLDT
jgi:hypothetical protein